MEMPSSPLAIVRMSCLPRGQGKRNATTMITNIAAARLNRRPAPQKGSSSRLLRRTAKKLLPPRVTAAANRA